MRPQPHVAAGAVRRPLRLLVVAPFPVFPLHAGGKIRIVKLARCLGALGFEVTVLAPYHFGRRPASIGREPFRLIDVKYPFLIPYLLTDRALPYGFLVSFHPGYRTLARDWLTGYDIYQIAHPAFADLLGPLLATGRPVIYGSQDVEYDYVRAECRSERARSLVGRRIHRLERQLVARSSHVTVCSPADRARMLELYGGDPRRITVIPNGIDDVRIGRGPSTEATRALSQRLSTFPRRAIFTGSDVEHNRVALSFIVGELAPRLVDECAFVIHGSCRRFLPHGAGPNVFLDPTEETLSHLAGDGIVGLNPVTQGSGTSLKVLQYLAHGLPVVSTPFGMRGYDDLVPLVTVAEREGFADALRRPPRPVADAPKKLAPYTWFHIAQQLRDLYLSVAGS